MIARPRSAFFLAFAAAVIVANPAYGQLSQLSFDTKEAAKSGEPVSARPDAEKLLDSILGSDAPVAAKAPTRASLKTEPAKKAARPAKAARTAVKKTAPQAARKRAPAAKSQNEIQVILTGSDGVPGKEYRFVAPRLEGPFVDGADAAHISSELTWSKKGAQQCWTVSSTESLKAKSGSLKEVLRRFTGNDDYFETVSSSACSSGCPKGTSAILSGLALVDARGGNFSIVEEPNSVCRYRLSKPAESGWQMLEGRKAVCSCVQ